ncbi:hypothetical protein [Salimicrobium humidisoli]|uniref:DUF4023 domain-containing protein n=1 Tax=Salimicrobium humidisoli TaxID=2029857 RepID=A0ABX4HR77_9BACI|nr:hypothetical protein [Salimicrobium humidisoli]PBB05737.1 hypothetical protein CKW00_06980 [Salimicrobium humidisoli]
MGRKKKNEAFRSMKDARNRKKPTDGTTWADKLLNDLHDGTDAEEAPKGKRKGSPESARRLRSDHN